MMKIFYVIICLIGTNLAFSQDYHYKFSLNGVVDLATAKEITDPLREKFICYPSFNDSSDFFEFNSINEITLNDLQLYLLPYGYTILFFEMNVVLEPVEMEEKK